VLRLLLIFACIRDVAAVKRRTALIFFSFALVVKRLAGKTSDVETLRGVYQALGATNFALIAESLPDAKVATLAKKFDKYNPDVKAESAGWRRRRLIALGGGSAEPIAKPVGRVKAAKTVTPAKKRAAPPQESGFLDFKSAGARRKKWD